MKLNKNSNPSLLNLLKMGAKVVLPDGRYLAGLPQTGYIDFGNDLSSMGLYSLDREGLKNILDAREFQQV